MVKDDLVFATIALPSSTMPVRGKRYAIDSTALIAIAIAIAIAIDSNTL